MSPLSLTRFILCSQTLELFPGIFRERRVCGTSEGKGAGDLGLLLGGSTCLRVSEPKEPEYRRGYEFRLWRTSQPWQLGSR